ncbi:MAG: DNA repair protein RecN [Proteobacteria bacterium]|jgi:DNA repair protein RecN (Recombination protein N)|nr:DNA repair protein RecN [Pseudomonadota bacterium]
MLTRLKIINFLLIEELELNFSSGFTVVTGETGSGKSIIIDALMIVFGMRITADIIRPDQKQAIFEAEFHLTNLAVMDWLSDNDLIDEDNPYNLLCKRVFDRSGKNKMYVNGNVVTVSQIKQIGDFILDVHVQHASITLLKQDMQRKLLDEYAGIVDKVQEIGAVFKKIYELENKIKLLLTQSEQDQIKKQQLLDMSIELDSLDLKDSEWNDLGFVQKQLANANFVLQELDFVNNILDGSVRDSITKLLNRLEKLEHIVPTCKKIIEIMRSVDVELVDAVHEVNFIANNIEQDPDKLSTVEDRINTIFNIGRKYKIAPDDIIKVSFELKEKLANMIDNSNVNLLKQDLELLNSQYKDLSTNITEVRHKTASILSNKITSLLHKLAISGEFNVNVVKYDFPHIFGMENIEYKVCFNKGMDLHPLAKVASGGELSRTALALYLLLSIHNPPEVIIFDEIDVGIGGKIAAIVGQMLKELGISKQVICITHQPQTASFGNNHMVVSKKVEGEYMKLNVSELSSEDRVNEIARMLSGMEVTDATIKHARDMLNMS